MLIWLRCDIFYSIKYNIKDNERRKKKMRNKKLWKSKVLAVACTLALGTASVPVLAAEVNTETGLSVEAESEVEAETNKSEDGTATLEEENPETQVPEEKPPVMSEETPVEEELGEQEKSEIQSGEQTETEESVSKSSDQYPELVAGTVKTDGTQDVTFYLKNGTGQYKIKSVDGITLGEIRYKTHNYGFTYDAETGALTIQGRLVRDAYADGVYFGYGAEGGNPVVNLAIDYTFENGEQGGTGIGADCLIEYTGASTGETVPKFVDSYQEFDGTKDLKFQFTNGTGNDKITAIKEVGFCNTSGNGSLYSFWIGNYGTSFTYDLNNGEVTLFKHAVSAIVYDTEKWNAVSDTFGRAYMEVEYADGRTGTVFARKSDGVAEYKADWKVKILEKADETVGQHYVEIPEGQSSLSKEDMEVLVNINKENDVIIKTSEGAYYSFGKGTMHLVDGKESYDLGLDLIKDFSQFTKMTEKEVPFSENEFGFYVKYNYSGELPGTAQITIPVDKKWVGQTLYYYEVMDNGTYRYTGQNAVVAEDGTYKVTQDHCSDYIALAKLLNTENEENNQKPEGNSNGNEQKPITGQTVKPATKTESTSPKTGDMSAVLPVLGTGITSLGVAVAALFRKRK